MERVEEKAQRTCPPRDKYFHPDGGRDLLSSTVPMVKSSCTSLMILRDDSGHTDFTLSICSITCSTCKVLFFRRGAGQTGLGPYLGSAAMAERCQPCPFQLWIPPAGTTRHKNCSEQIECLYSNTNAATAATSSRNSCLTAMNVPPAPNASPPRPASS